MEDDDFPTMSGAAYEILRAVRAPMLHASSTFASSVNTAITTWNDMPEDPDDGSAGVREPRRPAPAPPSSAVALDMPLVFL